MSILCSITKESLYEIKTTAARFAPAGTPGSITKESLYEIKTTALKDQARQHKVQ